MLNKIKKLFIKEAKVLPKGGDKLIVKSRKRIVEFIDKELKQLKEDLMRSLEK